MTRTRTIASAAAAAAVLAGTLLAPPAAASPRAQEIPEAAPPAAFAAEPELPAPDAWGFSEDFSRTSGTARYVDGALLWTDWLYDDTGDGTFTYADDDAFANGSDIFRAAVGAKGSASSWRVDFTTLENPDLPIAAWALDTDADAATGTDRWPAGAGVASAGSDAFLIMSSRGIWLEDAGGERTELTERGATLTVDRASKSFVAEIPRKLLRVNGTWNVRLVSGIAASEGDSFAAPPEEAGTRAYNVAFRTAEQEGERREGGKKEAAWNNGAQSEALRTGDVSPFALTVSWRDIARGTVDPEPAPTGFSTRWYASSVDLGPGLHPDAREPEGQPPTTDPRVYGRVQPYLVYVPEDYDPADPAPLTVLLHGGGSNHNGFRGANEAHLFEPVCEDRGSICVSPLGRGDGTWYVNEAELDVWEVWARAADAFALDGARTVVAGHSMGGVGATRFAVTYPDVFAGVGIVSGAGYVTSGGDRDEPDARLRVENLSNTRVFMDAGTADIAEQNTRDWEAAFRDAEVPHRVHYYAGAEHGDFGWLGWRELAEHLDDASLDRSPASIAFRWRPDEERTDLGLEIDSAHWMSGLAPRDAEASWSRVEARSGALDTGITESSTATGTSVYDGYETRTSELSRTTVGSREPSDELVLDLANIAKATIDLDAAGFARGASVTVRVASDGPATLRFTGGGAPSGLRIEGGTHVLELRAG